jgi:ATP-dependent Clp endopeptidase proteolytic subunit ClpP
MTETSKTTERIPTAEEIAAEVQKSKAEATKSLAEAERAIAEAEKARMEMRKLAADAVDAECDAAKAKVELKRFQEKYKRDLADDDHAHIYRFESDVNSSSAKTCRAQLAQWHRLDPTCDMEVEFNSPGGGIIAGMALFDTITEMCEAGHSVTTSCRGYAASMAGILLQAGTHRTMGCESYLLLHEAALFPPGGKIGEIEDSVGLVHKMMDRIVAIFAKRSKPPATKAYIRAHIKRKDWWLTSDEALKLGFVDELR